MIDPVTGWSKITQYDNKRAISITNLVETTWLTRYPRPMEITYCMVEMDSKTFIRYASPTPL